jgi:predicted AAA+ superfamily ATPase
MSAQDSRSLTEARKDGDYWGRLVESCIGAHLFNSSFGTNISVTYWRERNHEVDFVLQEGKATVAIEVKSGGRHTSWKRRLKSAAGGGPIVRHLEAVN